MAIPNLVDFHFRSWVGKIKFLTNLIIFTDVPRSFFFDVLFCNVTIGNYFVANMLMSLTLTQDDLAIPEPEGADFDGMP